MGTSLTIRPNDGEMLKPAELIELRGMGPLTLHDRRVFNSLIEGSVPGGGVGGRARSLWRSAARGRG